MCAQKIGLLGCGSGLLRRLGFCLEGQHFGWAKHRDGGFAMSRRVSTSKPCVAELICRLTVTPRHIVSRRWGFSSLPLSWHLRASPDTLKVEDPEEVKAKVKDLQELSWKITQQAYQQASSEGGEEGKEEKKSEEGKEKK